MNAAFAGFRHAHARALWDLAQSVPEIHVLGGWEENEAARRQAESWGAFFPYGDYEALLSDPRVELVILGDCYGKRGGQAIEALSRGKRVLADKPLCVRVSELDEIERISREKSLAVGCMLPLRRQGYARVARDIIQGGEWGQVRAILFTGQHPLLRGSRPDWYFSRGMHGGVITDIAVHGVDLIRYITGREMERVEFARTWNAYAQDAPAFRDCAQFAFRLAGGAGVMGDVSYSSPDSFGYSLDSYWRFQVWLDGGKLEFGENLPDVILCRNGETAPRRVPRGAAEGDCLRDMLLGVGTEDVISSMRATLAIQRVAGEGEA